MNWWAIAFVVFAIGMLPWQVLRYRRRKNGNDVPANLSKPKEPERDDGSFW